MATATEQAKAPNTDDVSEQLAVTESASEESREPSPVASADTLLQDGGSASASHAKKESAKARRREDKAIGKYICPYESLVSQLYTYMNSIVHLLSIYSSSLYIFCWNYAPVDYFGSCALADFLSKKVGLETFKSKNSITSGRVQGVNKSFVIFCSMF